MSGGVNVGRRIRIAVAIATVAVAGAGCARESRGERDAPVDRNLQDNQAPFIVNMPDGYMNLALKCLGKDLVIGHTRVAVPQVLPDHEWCAEGAVTGVPRVQP